MNIESFKHDEQTSNVNVMQRHQLPLMNSCNEKQEISKKKKIKKYISISFKKIIRKIKTSQTVN